MSADVETSLPAFFPAPAPVPMLVPVPPAPAPGGGGGVAEALPFVAASDCALFFLRAMSPKALVYGQLIRPVGPLELGRGFRRRRYR